MKKILTLALCLAATATLSAQKENVDQAAKLSGKIDKIGDARALIEKAAADPSTANDVRTYYTGGKVEFDAFDAAFTKRQINPQDPAINTLEMGKELINGYNMFLKALPLDSVPNEKGQVKPKHSKEMISKINGHHADYFNYAGEMFNNKHYYPEAYEAFIIYGDITKQPWASKVVKETPDSTVALAYHYAGIGAYSGNALPEALAAFEKARNAGITNAQNYVYEIACWQNMALRDSTLEQPAKDAILEIAQVGYNNFGISNPLFINNLVNSMLQSEKYQDAIDLISKQISQTPDKAFLYGLRGYVNDRMDRDDDAVADYRKAASFDDADVETLKNAAKKLYTTGSAKWNAIEGNNVEQKNDVKVNYWEAAKQIAERAKVLHDDSDIDYILENIDYVLETYF